MAKISGTYTIRIADQGGDAEAGASVLTIRVKTSSDEDAASVADAVGRELEKLGLTVPEPKPE